MKKTKTCSKCDTEKHIDNFHKSNAGKMGRRAECKKCSLKAQRKYYDKRKERYRHDEAYRLKMIEYRMINYYENREVRNVG